MIKAQSPNSDRSHILWVSLSLCLVVAILEYSTPSDYVFGYLYIGPILLASRYLLRTAILRLTVLSIILTILNLWIPNNNLTTEPTVANRLIAVLAISATGLLSIRNRHYQEMLGQQQAKITAQEELAIVREDFVSTLSHDLKTPLLGAIETLKAFQQGQFGTVQSAQTKVLETIIRSHHNSLQLVDTLLDIYRNDTEGLRLNLTAVDLVKLAEEIASSLFDLAASRRVYLSFNYGDSDFRKLLWVKGDPLQLQRVFLNLLTNAINHTPRGGKIEIVLESQPSYQVAKIIDTGAGITPEELPHLFERFYQGHSNRHAKGSGLGLYLTRQIVEAHGGNLWAENRLPHGALFGFRLPALPHPLS